EKNRKENFILVEIKDLWKSYQSGEETIHALRSVDLNINDGDFLCIMGESGAGKSTLLSILGGLNHPSKGKVIVDEIDIYSLTHEQIATYRSEYLGFVFQSFNLVPYLTVLENVMLPLAISDLKKKEKEERAVTSLERVGLKKKIYRLPDQLSGGEQERVAVARAIVNKPPIILADEPTGNLDTKTSREIMELFLGLNNERQTIIMVTHNPDNTKYANKKIVLNDGKVVNGAD
ncbi:MAG: ABC transporter ATP-binding protein, partial [Candidatus Schekmanbacteria bacterium GWA2_38_11]